MRLNSGRINPPVEQGPSLRDGKGRREAEQSAPQGRLPFSRAIYRSASGTTPITELISESSLSGRYRGTRRHLSSA